MPVPILVVDDHEIGRIGHHLLCSSRKDWQICAEASDGQGDSGLLTLVAGLHKKKPVCLA